MSFVVPPIYESIDFDESDLHPAASKFYTPYYKLDSINNEDHCVLFHSNRVSLVTISHLHPLLASKKTIASVNFQVNDSLNRLDNAVVGKSKAGAQVVIPESPLCHVNCTDGSKYTIFSCTRGKLLEVNENLISNPQLLIDKPFSAGYVAIVLPVTLRGVDKSKHGLLTADEYNDVRNHNAKK